MDSSYLFQNKTNMTKFLLAIFSLFLLSLNATVQILFGVIISIILPLPPKLNSDLLTFFNVVVALTSNLTIVIGVIFWLKSKTHFRIVIKRKKFHFMKTFLLFIVSITLIEVILSIMDIFFDILKLGPEMTSPYDVFFDNNINLLLFGLLAILIGPILEEIIYRFFIMNLIKSQSNSFFKPIIFSTLIFTFSHTLNDILEASLRYMLLHILAILILGLLLGYIFMKWGFASAVIFHSLWNLNSFIIQFLTSNYSQELSDNLSLFFMLITLIIVIVFLKKRWRFIIEQFSNFQVNIHDIFYPILNVLLIVAYQVFFPLFIYSMFGNVFLSVILAFISPLTLIITFILLYKEKYSILDIFSQTEKTTSVEI
ncbi:MAG: CPBP family glutamic-type intramembrane protease [Candidatus Hodarchaeales archaeon]